MSDRKSREPYPGVPDRERTAPLPTGRSQLTTSLRFLRILGVRSTPSSPGSASSTGACGAGNVPPALLRR